MGTSLKSRPSVAPKSSSAELPGDSAKAEVASTSRVPTVLLLGLLGSALMWAALPPLSWGWLAWVAPIPWLVMIQWPQLPGKRPYRWLYLAGFVFWLGAIHWLRLPHPATSLGWIVLSAYLAVYLPVFVGLSRVAVHSLRMPIWLATPVVWTGLELARAHLLTGFLMGALGHSQIRWTALLQISDLTGGYGVSFVIMFVAASLTSLLTPTKTGSSWSAARKMLPLGLSVCLVLAVLAYGNRRLGQFEQLTAGADPGPRLAVIQGNSLATWKHDPDKQQKIMDEYTKLSEQAVKQALTDGQERGVDLVVWPETMYRNSLVTAEDGAKLPEEAGTSLDAWTSFAPRDLAARAKYLNSAMLVGLDRRHVLAAEAEVPADAHVSFAVPPMEAYNSSILVDSTGTQRGTYDKVHRVMFGEYVPFADWVPFFDSIKGLTGGIEAGSGPTAMELDGVRYSPNICYETVIPHVIRRHFAELAGGGDRPDVLVNLTNDAWYWGSSELDMHLACGVFRAIECRTPLVIAANGGISASIDSSGRILAESPRSQTDVLIADVQLDPRDSIYVSRGDWFAGVCLLFCVVVAVVGFARRKSAKPNMVK